MDRREFLNVLAIAAAAGLPLSSREALAAADGGRLYEVPPPGERELYVSLFDRPVELRPGVELRGYVASGLLERFRRLEAGNGTVPP